MIGFKLVQIIPADGWYAHYVWENGERSANPIICWALVEWEDGKRTVEGVEVDDEMHLCCEYSGFRQYSRESKVAENLE